MSRSSIWPRCAPILGFAPQVNMLFSRSLQDNVAWGREAAGAEEVRDALTWLRDSAPTWRFYPSPWRLKWASGASRYPVDKNSAWQLPERLLVDPPILVLDDSLSSVDSVTEMQILKHLRERRQGRSDHHRHPSHQRRCNMRIESMCWTRVRSWKAARMPSSCCGANCMRDLARKQRIESNGYGKASDMGGASSFLSANCAGEAADPLQKDNL